MGEEEALVTAKEVMGHFGNMPRGTFYWLVREKRIPVHVLPPKPWRKRRELRFRISEVARALGQPEPPFYKT